MHQFIEKSLTKQLQKSLTTLYTTKNTYSCLPFLQQARQHPQSFSEICLILVWGGHDANPLGSIHLE